jgi:ribosomal protein L18E
VNDDQFNEKLVLPTTLLDQGDSDKKMQISHKQHTLLQSNKRKKIKNAKGRRKKLDQMTSKNQMRRVTDF